MSLTIFYDSQCPLCLMEMRELKRYDSTGQIIFEDLHHPLFTQNYPHIDTAKAGRILHGQLENGQMLYGLDVTCKAWSLAGKHRWLKLLRLPVIKTISDIFYKFFARYRYRISYVLTGKSRCTSCRL